jgi:hypothetical protein
MSFPQIREPTSHALILFLAAILLTGCASFTDYDSDHFDPGHTSWEQFVIDNRACQNQAKTIAYYDVHAIEGSIFNQHRMYNRAYSDCMKEHGYSTRSWFQNVVP